MQHCRPPRMRTGRILTSRQHGLPHPVPVQPVPTLRVNQAAGLQPKPSQPGTSSVLPLSAPPPPGKDRRFYHSRRMTADTQPCVLCHTRYHGRRLTRQCNAKLLCCVYVCVRAEPESDAFFDPRMTSAASKRVSRKTRATFDFVQEGTFQKQAEEFRCVPACLYGPVTGCCV